MYPNKEGFRLKADQARQLLRRRRAVARRGSSPSSSTSTSAARSPSTCTTGRQRSDVASGARRGYLFFRHVRVRILGSAAGGGFPQWNCRCETCEAARGGVRARPRTQSSLAIRGAEGPWFLVNASPDARQQLEALAPGQVDGVRAPPIAGVLLTDAEIDHTAGLLLLRESAGAGARVRRRRRRARAAAAAIPCCRSWSATAGPSGRRWSRSRRRPLEGSSLTVEPFEVGGDAPRYLDGSDVRASGERVRLPRPRRVAAS